MKKILSGTEIPSECSKNGKQFRNQEVNAKKFSHIPDYKGVDS
jgi:hypothetical protein